jgi:hypothetical protein
MAPVLFGRSLQEDYVTAKKAQKLLSLGHPSSHVLEVALTPRSSSRGSRPVTPRATARGPQNEDFVDMPELSEEEIVLAETLFQKYDSNRRGKLQSIHFYEICNDLELHLDSNVAKAWLGDFDEDQGLSLDAFKSILAGLLSAQTPAVRKASIGKPLGLRDMVATESQMRAAFMRCARRGMLSIDGLRALLKSLGFPDTYGDEYDRFVGEWLLLKGRIIKDGEAEINFHDFVDCANLLIDVSRRELRQK